MNDRSPVGWQQWKQEGRLYFWRFEPQKSGLTGWHFAADAEANRSLQELLALLTETEYASKRTLRLSEPPERVARIPFSPRPGRKIISPKALRLVFEPDADLDHWQVMIDRDHVEFRLGRKSIGKIADAAKRSAAGDFDFAIGPRNRDPPENIWFW